MIIKVQTKDNQARLAQQFIGYKINSFEDLLTSYEFEIHKGSFTFGRKEIKNSSHRRYGYVDFILEANSFSEAMRMVERLLRTHF